ncbi:MAG: hypothetical protein HY683_05120 [Chloroflexi bacterium]|nr:hypothetical protein [Chloroflexota bacterium]
MNELLIPVAAGVVALLVSHIGHFLWNLWRAGDRLALEDEREARRAAERERDEWKAKAGYDDQIIVQPRLYLGLWDDATEFGTATTPEFPKHGGRMLRLHVYFHADDNMQVERVRIAVAGERYEALGWETQQVDSITSGDYVYFPVDAIAPGTHDVRFEGYAEGKWWAERKAHAIEFPKL